MSFSVRLELCHLVFVELCHLVFCRIVSFSVGIVSFSVRIVSFSVRFELCLLVFRSNCVI